MVTLTRHNPTPCELAPESGFTLIEMSIVLMVIGLIVGGILTGQDLINAAAIRAQISQIEKYNTAVRTFQGKYGYLPGDIPNPNATNFGFQSRGIFTGEGDGDGELEGIWNNAPSSYCGICQNGGETVVFWTDLSTANLLDGKFSTALATDAQGNNASDVRDYLPAAKIGQNNYVYAWSGGYGYATNTNKGNGINYYGISAVTWLGAGTAVNSTPGLSVQQAYNIDKKVDDGLPQSGNITALYANNGVIWAGSGQPSGTAPYTTATIGSATSCFDNGNTAGVQQQYSVEQNGGSGLNCALSFQFQ